MGNKALPSPSRELKRASLPSIEEIEAELDPQIVRADLQEPLAQIVFFKNKMIVQPSGLRSTVIKNLNNSIGEMEADLVKCFIEKCN